MKNLNFLGLVFSILGGLLIASGIISSRPNIIPVFVIGAVLALIGIGILFINKDKSK